MFWVVCNNIPPQAYCIAAQHQWPYRSDSSEPGPPLLGQSAPIVQSSYLLHLVFQDADTALLQAGTTEYTNLYTCIHINISMLTLPQS